MQNNVVQLGGSTLIVTPGSRTGFALSHSNRSPVLLFEVQPREQSAEGVLHSLLHVLGTKADFVRYVLIVDAPGLPGTTGDKVNDTKAAAVALAAACGAELRSISYQTAKAIAGDAAVSLTDSTGLAAAVEKHRRKLAATGDKLGELIHPFDPAKQADHSDLRALARHVTTN